jgi:hypothetical protein
MRVKKVSYLNGYKLKVSFSDGKIKIVDFEDKIKNSKGIFFPLKNLEYFKKVALDDCLFTICRPNGIDICPDVLYKMGIDFIEKKKPPAHKKKVLCKR